MINEESPILLKIDFIEFHFGIGLLETILNTSKELFLFNDDFQTILRTKLCPVLIKKFSLDLDSQAYASKFNDKSVDNIYPKCVKLCNLLRIILSEFEHVLV